MSTQQFSAWNPGIESEIPKAYRELETIYNAANVFTQLDEVNQLAVETGLSPQELIGFRREAREPSLENLFYGEGDRNHRCGEDRLIYAACQVFQSQFDEEEWITAGECLQIRNLILLEGPL